MRTKKCLLAFNKAYILAFLFLFTNASAYALAPKRALVIGNSDYGGTYSLVNPKNDATAMASTLDELGFEVSLHLDVDLRGMKRAVSDFSEGLESSEATGLIYFAGHALEVEGVNYLLPIEFEINSAADLEYEAIDVQRVVDNMKSARKGLNIVMVDACRNNPFRGFRSIGKRRGVAQMNAPLGTFISSATASGDFAEDGLGKNSPYTAAVLKHIKEPGLTLEQVFKKVRIDVLQATGGAQVPWESSSITSDFFFAGEETQKELEEIAEDELAQSLIREQAKRDKEQADRVASLLKNLEEQKQQLELANKERARLAALVGSEEQKNSSPSPDFQLQQEAVDMEVARLREEEKALLAKKKAQEDKLLDICDSMAEKFTTSLKTVECYQKFLTQEDPDSGRAIRGLSNLKDNVVSALNLALVGKKLSSARKSVRVLTELSPNLVPSYQQRIEVLEKDIQKAKTKTRKKVKAITTF